MNAFHTAYPEILRTTRLHVKTGVLTAKWPVIMLFTRIILFTAFQALFALAFSLSGVPGSAWDSSAAWWPFTVTLTNLVCIAVLVTLFRREDASYFDLLHFDRKNLVRDVLTVVVVFLISGPLSYLPNIAFANLFYGDYMVATNEFIRPLPVWAAYLSLVFAFTQGLVELPVYFGYVMPRLDALSGKKWLGLTAAGLMLAAQHIAVPLIFDWRFIFWRLLMFLPFAFFIGACLRWRPRLFPYIMIGHVLIDIATVAMVIMRAIGKM